MVLVAVEAGSRVWRRSPPGELADRLEGILLVVLFIAIAGGLGLLVGGARPHELLHFVYAIVALSALPIAGILTREVSPRARGIAGVIAALVALVVVARLFGTG